MNYNAIKPLILVCLLLSQIGQSMLCTADEKQIVVGACIGCEPFGGKNLKHFGPTVRTIKEALEMNGYQVKIEWFPWKRGVVSLDQGDIDMMATILRTPEREAIYNYSEEVLTYNRVFFHFKETPFKWEQLEDLKGLTIGCITGYYYGEWFETLEKDTENYSIRRLTTPYQVMGMLTKKRIDVALLGLDLGMYEIHKSFPEAFSSITHSPNVFEPTFQYVVTSKQNPNGKEMITALNKGLRTLRESGLYQQYYEESRRGEYMQ